MFAISATISYRKLWAKRQSIQTEKTQQTISFPYHALRTFLYFSVSPFLLSAQCYNQRVTVKHINRGALSAI